MIGSATEFRICFQRGPIQGNEEAGLKRNDPYVAA
jgi:hypothetical protein